MLDKPGKLGQFWKELKRRRVIRRNMVYAATGFVFLELVSIIAEPFGLPDWSLKVVFLLLCVGFVVSAVLSWFYDFTPDGIVKISSAPKAREVPPEKPARLIAWKIATYTSIVVIAGLVLLNLSGRSKRSGSAQGLSKSIAVLPFISLSDDPDKQYLADGMMDAIVLHLSKIEDLHVIARTSVEQYRETTKTISAIGQELGVEYLLEGSFQKHGESARLIVQLINARDETHKWSNEYDRSWNNIFYVQSEVAQSIARELSVVITPEEKQLIEKPPTANLTAYDFYQRGREEYLSYTLDNDNHEALERSRDLYLTALEYDSTFARAYSGLANVYGNINAKTTYFSIDYLDSLLILCDIALSYDPQLSEAYTGRAYYYYQRNEMRKALAECDRAIKFNPNDWLAYYYKGIFYTSSGSNFVEAFNNLYKARTLHRDESLPAIFFSLGRAYAYTGFTDKASRYFQQEFALNGDSVDYLEGLSYIEGHILGHYEKAIELSRAGYGIDSNDTRILSNLGKFHLFLGQYKESLKYYEKLLGHLPEWGEEPQGFLHRVAFVLRENGYPERADNYFNRLIEECKKSIDLGRRYSSTEAYYDLASTYAVLGNKEEAYQNLKIFVRSGHHARFYITLLKNDPFFDGIRDEPEFQQAVREMEAKSGIEYEKVRDWLEKQGML